MRIAGAVQSSRDHHEGKQGSEPMVPKRGKYLRTARVADRMTSSITVVSPETRLGEVLHLFTTMNIRTVAVYDAKEYMGLIGSASLKEAMGDYPLHVRVREVMDTKDIRVDPCSPDELLSEAWKRMRQNGQTSLPVLDVQGKLTGVLSAPGMEERFPTLESNEAWGELTPRRPASDN